MAQNKVKKILISGGSGFVGKNIIQALKDRTDIKIYNLSNAPIEGFDNVENIFCDAKEFNFDSLSMDFDYIIHLLALSNEKYCQDFSLAEEININFTKKILEFAKKQKNLQKFIHLSSIIIYDNKNVPPVTEEGLLHLNYSTYAFTKGVSEYYVDFYREKYSLPIVIFRLSNIYGPYQDFNNSPFLVPSKIVEGVKKKKITVFNLMPKRDWIYSCDAAEAIIKALESDITGIYNLATGKGISVEEIVSCIASYLKVSYTSLDKPTTGPLNFYCDITKIKSDLNWAPRTSLVEGIKSTIEHFKDIQQTEKFRG